jgi:hypothetical protein
MVQIAQSLDNDSVCCQVSERQGAVIRFFFRRDRLAVKRQDTFTCSLGDGLE